MGVAFGIYTSGEDFAPHIVTCGCPGAVPFHFPNRTTAEEWLDQRRNTGSTEVPIGCTDELCAAYGLSLETGDVELREVVHLSNANARRILDRLGLDGADICGSAMPADFLGRVLCALAVDPDDAGVPEAQQGNMIDCGRRPGYTQDVLNRLHRLATIAARRGGVVSWA